MSHKPKHSKLPWRISPAPPPGRNPHRWLIIEANPERGRVCIAEGAAWLPSDPYDESRANRDLIVKAVNSHDELLAAAKIGIEYMESADEVFPLVEVEDDIETVRAAIDKAESPQT